MLLRAVSSCVLLLFSTASALAQLAVEAPVPPVGPELPERPGRDVVTVDWLVDRYRARSVADLRWLPDGHQLVASAYEGDQPPQIVLFDANTGARTVLAMGRQPQPSPDGVWIGFLRDDSIGSRLWAVHADGTAAHPISRDRHVTRFEWSPDSRRVAYAAAGHREPPARDADTTRPSAVVAHAADASPPDDELWIAAVSGGEEHRLLAAPLAMSELRWLSANAVLFAGMHFTHYYGGDASYMRIGLSDTVGDWRTVIKLQGFYQSASRPALSPDRRQLAVTTAFSNGPIELVTNLGLISLAVEHDTLRPAVDATVHRVTRDVRLSDPEWAPDGRRIYALRHYGAFKRVYVVGLPTGGLRQVTSGPTTVEEFSLSRNGRRMAMVTMNAHGRQAISVADVRGDGGLGPVREVAETAPLPAGVRLGAAREIAWTTVDGVEMRGMIVLPLGYTPGKRYPLVVEIHGGGWGSGFTPQGTFVRSPLEWQMWAAKGYVVLHPDYRSTGAYGQAGLESLFRTHELDKADIRDVLGGVDSLVHEGIVDSARTAVYGTSAGGFHTNLLVAYTRNRFQAAVSHEGWADDLSCSGAAIGCTDTDRWMHGGYPWEVPEYYRDYYPLDGIRGATTPTLFLMGGTRGTADWTLGVQKMYSALRRQGVPTMYVRYPDEGHGLERPANVRDGLERTVAWIDRFLQPRVDSSTE
jgi:dipeptidyl aminopeptidase/acylaminoacyl peptidase